MNERAAATKSDAKKWATLPRPHKINLPRPDTSAVDKILYLQQSIGNQIVQRLFDSGIIQAKLTVGRPDDVYEQEADRVAGEVMRMPEPKACCGPAKEKEESIRRKEASGESYELTNDAERQMQSLHGGGNPLSDSERAFMEPRFGVDFGSVRVHSDARAAASARAINAQAFTFGRDIVFGAGHYSPDTSEGRRLLAHELTHVVQQDGLAGMVRRQQQAPATSSVSPERSGIISGTRIDQFLRNSAELTKEQLDKIDTVAWQIALHLGNLGTGIASIKICGHTDTTGTEKYNQGLGLERAQKAKSALLAALEKRQVSKERIKDIAVESKGEIDLAVPTKDNVDEPRNRRVEIEAAIISQPSLQAPAKGPSLSLPPTLIPPIGVPPQTPSQEPPASPSLSDLLTFKFKKGALEFAAELPKSVSVKLPIALRAAKNLVFELKAETSGSFSFSITFNGLPHVSVIAKAQLNVDKEKGASGETGLEIQLTRTVCSASNPEVLKANIKSSGEKLQGSMKELEKAKPDERISKLFDIASAIGDMYDAVDKSKSTCKETPAATLRFGVQGPLGQCEDPKKCPPTYFGPSVTIPF